MKWSNVLIWIIVLAACGTPAKKPMVLEEVQLQGQNVSEYPAKLSEWKLLQEPMKALVPAQEVMSYQINSPLFSDYALKSRMVKLPSAAHYHADKTLDFPEGTILVKHFYYPADFQVPEGNRRILETRLLIKEQEWKAITYVWNKEQTEAFLEIAGATIPVSWKDREGILQKVNYSVPNQVQCKSCHERNGRITPIGPTVRQLNRPLEKGDNQENQLVRWQRLQLLDHVPLIDEWPIMPAWDDPDVALAARARAWLDVNCGHCHQNEGPAKNTGLYLNYTEKDLYKLGIMKPPVAAGRGSGGLRFDIVPGQPENSILYHRINSTDPGVMMPELGRKMIHKEGTELIAQWITSLGQ